MLFVGISGVARQPAQATPIPVNESCPIEALRSAESLRPLYRASLELDASTATVSGTASVRFTPDLATDRVVLRLWPNGGIRDATAPTAEVSDVLVGIGDGASGPVRVSRPDSTTVLVNLAQPVAAGEVISVEYRVVVRARGQRSDRVSATRTAAGALTAARFGSFLPLLAWEPGVGWNRTPPTRTGAEATMSTVADWDVTMLAPEGLTVLGSGELVSTDRWVATAHRDWSMSIGRFSGPDRLVTGKVDLGAGRPTITVTVGVTEGINESAAAYRKRVIAALKDLSIRYGDYPYSSYSLAITPGLKGGIENPSHVMQGPGSIGRTTTHEVAHMWFYSWVGNDQGRDPWIDEGLATWAEARVDRTLSAFLAKPIPPAGKNKAGASMTYWDANRGAYYRSVYVQTLQALAALGDPDDVDCALRLIVARHGHRVATSAQVIAVLTERFPKAPAILRRYGISP
jgi:hypothetical protein